METSTPTPVTNQFTLSRLFHRAWTILFKEPRGKGRISRGERIVSGLLLGLITNIITVPLSRISSYLPLIVSILAQLRAFGYLMRKAQDLGKSKKYVLLPFGGLFVLTTLMGIMGLQLSPNALLSGGGWILMVLGLLIAIFVIRSLVIIIQLLGKRGTVGDNAYGSDPLLHQPKGNGLYRGAGILLFIAIIVVSFFQRSQPTPNYPGVPGSEEYEQMQQLNEQIQNLGDQAQIQDIVDQAVAEQEGTE